MYRIIAKLASPPNLHDVILYEFLVHRRLGDAQFCLWFLLVKYLLPCHHPPPACHMIDAFTTRGTNNGKLQHSSLSLIPPSSQFHPLKIYLAITKNISLTMRLLDAANLVLPMMFLSRSSGLDDISLPIQSLSLAPFVVRGTQSGFFHGLQVHSSLPPITQVVDTFIPAVRRWLYLSAAEVVQVSNSPKLKFPIQPQCTRLDSPVFANSSKVISDSPTVLDFASYSPPATVHAEIVFRPVEWKVVLAWIAVSLLTVGFIFLEEHASAMLSDVSYDRITALNVPACSRVILGVLSCGLLANYRLSEDANPHGALAGVGMIMYMLGEVRSLEALCRIGHVVRLLFFLLCSFAYRFFFNRSCPLRFLPLLPPCLYLRRRMLLSNTRMLNVK